MNMKSKILKIYIISFILIIASQVVSAEIYTSDKIEQNSNTVYVAGNDSFYPIEYYNHETKKYEGVLPEILKNISDSTGINFTYLHNSNISQTELAQNLQAEIVSAYITDSQEDYAIDNIKIISYLSQGKTVNVGWAFTKTADPQLIQIIKNECSKITSQQINGYLIDNSHKKNQDITLSTIAVLCLILLTILIIMVCLILRNTKKQMYHNRMTDTQTGIGNLVCFEHHFNNIISDFSRNLYYIAYIIIDSNYLQIYHGESTFTDAVKYTANTLASYSKENEIAARITENGFAFAFQSSSDKEAELLITEITNKLTLYISAENKNSKPVFHAAVYNLNASDLNCGLLLFNLRKNCSKLVGTDSQLILCDAQMMNSAINEKILLESISKGFKNHEFKLYLQFIVDNKTKHITSAEALSRWHNPESGILTPANYIKEMESNGMITTLDYYMFEMVCIQLHKWKDTEFDNITISCNFTRITLSEDDFFEKIKDISNKYVFEKSKLIIEITEDAIEKNRENALNNVLKCKNFGFKIALDDLGSGYTSLLNLCEYPIDIVKIDRDILLNTDKKNGKDLFIGIIALAHSLNLKVVCEGVETNEQNALVTNSDCDFIQGWYYSKALPTREGEEFIHKYSKNNLNA